MKTVFQTDVDGLFLYETRAAELPLSPGQFNVPFGAYEEAPPAAPPGFVAQRQAAGWKLVEDHRRTTLWIASTGEPYRLGHDVEVEDELVAYRGTGPIPSWLTVEGGEEGVSQTDDGGPQAEA